MAAQEWDDHDRSEKLLAPDLAKDYLNSCPKNSILFTYGDNDTYPLWYAQEVEGVRPDIRIINTSLLGIDWYVNQLRHKINQSDAIDVIWSEDQVRGLAYLVTEDRKPRDGVFDLLDVMKTIGQQKPKLNSFPAVRTVSVPVDVATAKANGVVTAKDSVLSQLVFNLPDGKNFYTLDQLTILNIIAANAWKRPICFTSPDGSLGFGAYLRQQGMAFQLVPVMDKDPGRSIETDTTYKLLTTVFRAGNANNPGVYFDEENRRHLLSIRSVYAQEASALADEAQKQKAVNVLAKSESLMNPKAFPYAMTASSQNQNNHNRTGLLYLEAAYKAGYTDLAKKVKTALVKDLQEQLAYYKYLRENKEDYYYQLISDERDAQGFLQIINQFEEMYEGKRPPVQELPQGARAADSTK